jgi:hypothetical protein
LTGRCAVSNFPISPAPPWVNLDAFGQPTDTCGDIDAAHSPLYSSIQNIQVACVDTNGDGNLDINTGLSWRQPGANDICTSPIQAFPGGPAKCHNQTLPSITISVPGVIKVDKVTVPSGDPTSFNFTLSGGPNNLNQLFSLTDAASPFSRGALQPGTYSVAESVSAGWTLSSMTCQSDQAGRTPTPGSIALHLGETVTCTFTNVNIPTPTNTAAATPTKTSTADPAPTSTNIGS